LCKVTNQNHSDCFPYTLPNLKENLPQKKWCYLYLAPLFLANRWPLLILGQEFQKSSKNKILFFKAR